MIFSGKALIGKNTGDKNIKTVVMITVVWLTSLKNTPKEAKIHDKPRLKIIKGRKTKGINIIVQCIITIKYKKAVSKTSRLIAV
jgi:hypothetical protein